MSTTPLHNVLDLARSMRVRVWASLPGRRAFPGLGDEGRVVSRLEDARVRIQFARGTVDLSVTDLTCLEHAEGPCYIHVMYDIYLIFML